MITLFNPPVKEFTHIIHIADIHIRLNKRHSEYRTVFNELYEEVKTSPETTVVALLGDIFHTKLDLSPEAVQLASELFKNIADIRPLVIIAGNHDCSLSNKSRLDSITPVVDALTHPNIYYLKTTGLYGFGNILWNNMSVFDTSDKYILGKDIPQIYRNQYKHIIALFHGPIDGASTETGLRLMNPSILPSLFDNHHIALCGDIHLMQNIQDADLDYNKPCIRYCSSLVQQNHGEPLTGHGYSLWDLSDYSYSHNEIPNKYGYFTVDIHKGRLATDISILPEKLYLRLRCFESISSEVKSIISRIKQKSEIIEISYLRDEKEKESVSITNTDIILTDLGNVDYQNKLITDFILKKHPDVTQIKLNEISKINRNVNQLIKKTTERRNLKWKPIKFEWDNMFTYGEGNYIDFTQMSGTYGIFGNNRTGKSSILSAFIFCLFDKFDRGYKGSHVLNVQKTSFKCKLELEIDGYRYFIERTGTLGRTGNVKVDVEFWRIVNDVVEPLHGVERTDTNEIIRNYIGTYDNFILTSAAFQTANGNNSFITMGNTDRKDILVQFIGLDIFDQLYEQAGERNKELNTLLKIHKDKNYIDDKFQTQNAFNHASTLVSDLSNKINVIKSEISNINDQILTETSNLIKLDADVPTNINILIEQNRSITGDIEKRKKALIVLNQELADKNNELLIIESNIKEIEKSNLVESHKKYKSLNDQISKLNHSISIKKVEIKNKLGKKQRLSEHKYDPNCKFCIDNEFVRDATKAVGELVNDKIDTDLILEKLSKLNLELQTVKWVEKAYETYTTLLNKKSNIKDECAIKSKNILINTNESEKLESALKIVLNKIEIYNRNDVSVNNNISVQDKISKYRSGLNKLNIELQIQNNALISAVGKREVFASQISGLDKTIKDVEMLEIESVYYQLYLSAVGRDGIPYQVICNTVPTIEREVNSILNQIVDYTVQFETDGKNIIPYVVYHHGRWPIELTSGFERFVASLAIRTALTNISNLPKCNILSIDEGFGALDANNIISMPLLFSYLKNSFDIIFIISHLDTLKDAVDKQIDIKLEGSLSKVIYQ